MSYKLLIESFGDINIEEKFNETTKQKDLYISGLGLRAEIKNKNGRIYPKAPLFEAVDKHVAEKFQLGKCLGELEHPEKNAHQINPDRMSHRFVDIKKEGNEIWLKAFVLNTREGIQLRNIIEGGVTVGFSSRCLGQTKNINGSIIVQPNLRVVSLADVVLDPSVDTSMIEAIYENKEWVWENGALVEKDLSQDIDEYQKLIKSTTKAERSKVFENIITDYFRKILK